ncbi:MAG: CheY-like chemotaxis protein [Myxococcota bacterium]|jgi:CheY-like chemotaxis protein
MSPSPQHELQLLLRDLFDRAELERVLRRTELREVVDEVVWDVPFAEVAYTLVGALVRRGQLGAAFFDALVAERPNRSADIARVRARFPPTLRQTRRPRLLWVDDEPVNIAKRAQRLGGLGFALTLTTSTADAVALLGAGGFAAVLSDMRRSEESESGSLDDEPAAGLKLLAHVRYQLGSDVPLLVVTSAQGRESWGAAVEALGGVVIVGDAGAQALAGHLASRGVRPPAVPQT